MSSGETASGACDPQELYQRRLEQLKSTQALDETAEQRLGYAKLAVASITVAAAIVLLYYSKFLVLVLLPAGFFVFLAIRHETRLRRIRERRRSIDFYERGMARMEDRWAGTGETGERFL
jgi:hypothetical protein